MSEFAPPLPSRENLPDPEEAETDPRLSKRRLAAPVVGEVSLHAEQALAGDGETMRNPEQLSTLVDSPERLRPSTGKSKIAAETKSSTAAAPAKSMSNPVEPARPTLAQSPQPAVEPAGAANGQVWLIIGSLVLTIVALAIILLVVL